MLGLREMSQPTGQERAPVRLRLEGGAARAGVVALAYLALLTAHCTFPEYDTNPGSGGNGATSGAVVEGGTGGAGGTDNRAGGGGGSGSTSGAGGTDQGGTENVQAGGFGGDESMGGSPECTPPQWPIARCEGACWRRFPDHCYDEKPSGDELASDCGGSCQRCTNEPCHVDDDCLSGKCTAETGSGFTCRAPLTITYTAHELNSMVATTAWSLVLRNEEPADGRSFIFKDLKVRYYFDRSGVTEPIYMHGMQSNLRLENGESKALNETSWTVEHVEDVEGGAYDAYVEVAFDDTGQLFPGDRIELYQQMRSGDQSKSNFDQRTHYSFSQTSGPSLTITAHYQDELL
jgi:hypothetical protein